jgi:membrane protein YqaA with SNARE-associated domain
VSEPPSAVVAPRRGLHHRLYRWVLHWAGHPRASTALFVLAFAEASFFPVPPDVLLMAMSLSVPRHALRYATLTTLGSVSGGLGGYLIGFGVWQAIAGFCFEHLQWLGFTPQNFARVQGLYQDNAFLAVFTAGFTPIPYKVFTIAAGVFEIALPVFVLASILGRAGRFFLVALLVGRGGAALKPFIERYLGWLTVAFVALLILGFWLVGRLGSH